MENTQGQEARAATSRHLYSSKEWHYIRNVKKETIAVVSCISYRAFWPC